MPTAVIHGMPPSGGLYGRKAMLTVEQITGKEARPGSRIDSLSAIRTHQDWVRFHTQTRLLPPLGSEAWGHFQTMVKSLLPPYKCDLFFSLLKFPLPSTELCSVIFDRLSRVFEGRNPVYDAQFRDKAARNDWERYRQEYLDEPGVWRNRGWDYFKTEPNSVLVVDMPADGKEIDGRPAPYFYWVTADDIIDFGTKDDGTMDWIIFRSKTRKRIYAIDDTYYRSFAMSESNDSLIGNPEDYTENRHGLGCCPATFFLSEPVSLEEQNVKKSAVTTVLGALDWFVFFHTSEKHLDLYASYPIYSGYEKNCGYEKEVGEGDDIHTEHCRHGLLYDDDEHPIMVGGQPKRCPVCGNHQITGAGTWLTVPEPGGSPDDPGGVVPDMLEAVKMLGVDRESLDFNDEKVKKLENAIINRCVGVEGNVFTEFSISDKQVDANYESQSTILVRVKKAIEDAQWFVDDKICRLRYGDSYDSLHIDYGTEFYTLTTEQMRKRYADAVGSGANQSDLAALRRKVLETEYRQDPMQMRRMLLLSDIEPLSGVSAADARAMVSEGIVDREDVAVKVNFESLLRRFERENGSVESFGVEMEYRDKVGTIQETLKSYIREYKVKENINNQTPKSNES